MAEILLSLTIIGVVAAITLPSLTGNINERTWNTQRKALYARMSQAIALMPALNGFGKVNPDENLDNAAETFINNGLAKVLKLNNVCTSDNLKDCGITSKISVLNGTSVINIDSINTLIGLNNMFDSEFEWNGLISSWHQANTKAAAFETQNGESILTYYNPWCRDLKSTNTQHYAQAIMCANFIYDLNGTKGPNVIGKDMGFISVLYPSDPVVVAPMPLSNKLSKSFAQTEASKACTNFNKESRLPNINELSAMFINSSLLGSYTHANAGHDFFYSGTKVGIDGKVWIQHLNDGIRTTSSYPRSSSLDVWCIKR